MANPWYAFYVGDYGRDTAHCSLIDDGAYRRLLDYYYATGRPLPRDIDQLFRICRAFTPAEQQAVHSVLKQFFVEDGDVYRQGRVDRELAKQCKYKAKLSEGARKTNLKRWGQSPSDSPSDSGSDSPSDRKPQPQKHSLSELCSDGDSSLIKQKHEPCLEAEKLAQLLADEIHRNKADYRITPAKQRSWAVIADRMIRLDRREPEKIEKLIRWVQHDEFEMSNVLSMDKLRARFDQLELKRDHKQKNGVPVNGHSGYEYVPDERPSQAFGARSGGRS